MPEKAPGQQEPAASKSDTAAGPEENNPENGDDERDPVLEKAVKDLGEAAENLEHVIEYYI